MNTNDSPNSAQAASPTPGERVELREAYARTDIWVAESESRGRPNVVVQTADLRLILSALKATPLIGLSQGEGETGRLIEQAGLDAADTIERHLTSPDAIWGLPELPEEWMTSLRSITVAALEQEIPKLLAALSGLSLPGRDDEARARELLAAQYDAESRPIRAQEVRTHGPMDDDDKRAIRAIVAALSTVQDGSVREEVA